MAGFSNKESRRVCAVTDNVIKHKTDINKFLMVRIISVDESFKNTGKQKQFGFARY